MSLSLLGFLMIGTFTVLVMTRKMGAVAALMIVAAVFSVLAGRGADTGGMMMKGIQEVAPTAIMLVFAVLYFGLMIDVGLFKPLVDRIIGWVTNDPRRVTVGHAALASVVGLDGDGTTTAMVSYSSIYPVYRRLAMNPLIYAVIGSSSFIVMNMSPWGGPTARAAAALKVDVGAIFVPLLPVAAVTLALVFVLAAWFGRRERARLDAIGAGDPPVDAVASLTIIEPVLEPSPELLRPRLIWFNLALSLLLMTLIIARAAPLPVLFMGALAIALTVNFPQVRMQSQRIAAHAGNALQVGVLILAAGAFTGILSGTGMIDAMAASLLHVVPEWMGPHMALITALLSIPMNFLLSSDAFFFGVLPLLGEAGAHYGVAPERIARAAMLGLPAHTLSPLVAAVYLKCSLIGIELGDLQRFAWKYALGMCFVMIGAAVLLGVI